MPFPLTDISSAMAFCAPKQLSLSLPTIIPQLTGVINDSHAQVKSAANTSLKRFGEVLSNPEIKAIQGSLMKALADPTGRTNAALAALLKTSFEHYLDAPSLALVSGLNLGIAIGTDGAGHAYHRPWSSTTKLGDKEEVCSDRR
jgi:hypothetical protein